MLYVVEGQDSPTDIEAVECVRASLSVLPCSTPSVYARCHATSSDNPDATRNILEPVLLKRTDHAAISRSILPLVMQFWMMDWQSLGTYLGSLAALWTLDVNPLPYAPSTTRPSSRSTS